MWPNPQETTDLVTFSEEIYNKKLKFFCAVRDILVIATVINKSGC